VNNVSQSHCQSVAQKKTKTKRRKKGRKEENRCSPRVLDEATRFKVSKALLSLLLILNVSCFHIILLPKEYEKLLSLNSSARIPRFLASTAEVSICLGAPLNLGPPNKEKDEILIQPVRSIYKDEIDMQYDNTSGSLVEYLSYFLYSIFHMSIYYLISIDHINMLKYSV
jgi:hypothetical protein